LRENLLPDPVANFDRSNGDANLRTEVNALQFGMNGLGKNLLEAKAEIEKSRSLVS